MVLRTFPDSAVPTAFPEFDVELPNVGEGMDKVAFKVTLQETPLALKILHEPVPEDAEYYDDQAHATERFRREQIGMAATDCVHIVRVINEPQIRKIDDRNFIWYSEPFLTGGTLHERLRHGPLQADEVHRLGESLLLAIQAMWNSDAKFVHRDIKPKNIGYMSDGTPVLIDLGIALFTEMVNITTTSLAGPGTTHYAAPEQFVPRRYATIDFRTDLFQALLT